MHFSHFVSCFLVIFYLRSRDGGLGQQRTTSPAFGFSLFLAFFPGRDVTLTIPHFLFFPKIGARAGAGAAGAAAAGGTNNN